MRGGKTKEGNVPLQVAALGRAVIAYAEYIDNVAAIMPIVQDICHKHVSRGVVAPHYDAVGECLLAALRETLGEAATPGIMTAWEEAYGFLAKAFIDTETKIKAEMAKKAGYDGMALMTVERVTDENKERVFVLARKDGGVVGTYGKGQYVAVQVKAWQGQESMTTLTLRPGESGKITAVVSDSYEKASIAVRGLRVGDTVPVSMPCGKVKA